MSCPGILVFKHDSFSSQEVLSASCLLPPSNTHYPPTSPPPPQTVSTASELRKPIYWIVAAKAIDYEQMLLLMAGVKWDIREIMSQHNVYVDVLLKVILLQEGPLWTAVGDDARFQTWLSATVFGCVLMSASASPRRHNSCITFHPATFRSI